MNKRSLSLLAALAMLSTTGCVAAPSFPRATAPSEAAPAAGTGSAKTAAPAVSKGAATSPVSNNAGAIATGDAAIAPTTPGTAGGIAPVPPSQQTSLKAGSVDDNASFSDYLSYLKNYSGQTMRPLDVSGRHVIKVTDADGHSVSNADVTVSLGGTQVFTGKTYADGTVLFHPNAKTTSTPPPAVYGLDEWAATRYQVADATTTTPPAAEPPSYQVAVSKGDDKQTQSFVQGETWSVKLPKSEAKPAPKLDVCFLIDTTGSMGGEIAKLQSTITSMSTRIKALDGQPSVRFGLVAYRDRQDDYVTQKTDFTADVGAFQSALNGLSADGGGDLPEDMEAGLAAAVNNISWDTGDTVRLTFLVADAEAHLDYPQTIPYTTTALKAVSKGIKIFPIGCSGLPPQGEYMMRQLAQLTSSQYLFITRGGDEGTGGGDVSATVDKFQEGRLDDIVVDIVKAELGSLGK